MGVLSGRYPDDIARNAEGGHGYWSTQIVTAIGGYETATQLWELAKGRWNVARALELTALHEVARSHFYKARGAFHHFRFKDWHDYKCARTGTDKGRLTGSTTAWQINKVYGTDDGTHEYVRPLHRIVAGSVRIWRNTTLQTLATHYTVDNDTGVVTSLSSWAGDTLEVSCEFDVLCRYDLNDFAPRLAYRLDEARSLFEWERIPIVEVRE